MKYRSILKKAIISLSVVLSVVLINNGSVSAASSSNNTGVEFSIKASGRYVNWDGVTNAAQLRGADGNLYFALDQGSNVVIYKTNSQMQISGQVTLAKQHSIFGTVVCDGNGNYYLVTGENNSSNATRTETVFISKYDSNGNLIASVGDNGSSSLASYYDDSFYTQAPFDGGCCDAAISGNYLTVYYAREMYSGHQSCSAFTVNINDLSKVTFNSRYDNIYQSHSFAQRVISSSNGFVYVSEGDCYDRAFVINSIKISGDKIISNNEHQIFDFWVQDGALDSYNMYVVNDNFAHMGGLAALSDGRVAFAAQSVKSLNSNANNESEEVFIQIFDPYADLSTAFAYTTTGTRNGLAGPNGRTNVTNYGVKWLTNHGTGYKVENVQIAVTSGDNIVVLYELSAVSGYQTYKGVYYIVLDKNGNVVQDATLYSEEARLNPCETPVSVNGKICWVGNSNNNRSTIYTYCLDLSGSEGENDDSINFDEFIAPEGCVFQFRLYNPNSGEHFYTGSQEEVLNLVSVGWNFEGSGFITPTVGDPIYRLYSAEHGDHYYTTNVAEKNALVVEGWTLDGGTGIAFPSADASTGRPMYKVHNPNAYPNGEAGAHHFTMSWEEVQNLVSIGWQYEGIAWYSV